MKAGIRLRAYDELMERLDAAKLELAFHLMLKEEMQNEDVASPDEALQALKEKERGNYYLLMARGIAEQRRKNKRLHRLQSMKKIALTACVIIAFLSVSFTTALALSSQLQTYMSKLLVRRTEKLVTVGMQVNRNAVAPEGWQGEYFPAYIPEGFELKQINRRDFNNMPFVRYDYEERLLDFSEMPEYASTSIAGEDVKVSQTTVHDREALVVEGNGYVEIIWAEYNRYFIVGLTGTADEAIAIARSVERIK